MFDCPICGTRHSENPEVCKNRVEAKIRGVLSTTFEQLLQEIGDTPTIRLMIANYTVGYMGASFGLHIPS
jgi:hypothetical protein